MNSPFSKLAYSHLPQNKLHMKILLPVLLLLSLCSCHTPPENYEKGMTLMQEKKWDKAIESFNLLTSEDKDWLDPATVKKEQSFILLLNSMDWKRTFRVLEKNQDDDDFMFAATDNIDKYFHKYISSGRPDSVLKIIDEHKIKLEEFMDTIFTQKIVRLCEDSLFVGIWKGQGSLSVQEIYFKRDGDEMHA